MASLTFSEYGERSEMMQLTEGDCPRSNNLPHVTKIHCSIENIKRLLPLMGCVDEALFEERYGRIIHLLKIPIQTSAIKALTHFWDPNYRCFTFGNIDMTPTIEEYAQILSFPHNPLKVYFRQKIEDTVQEVIKLLHLDPMGQYMTSSGDFKWKAIENKLKADKDKRRLREEGHRLIAFAIFGLILFPSEAVGIISIEAASAFVEYEQERNNPASAILAETFLSLNHCRSHGKGAMRCCIPLLFIWIVSHLETPKEVFNNFWWFNMRPLSLVLNEEWKGLDERAWVEKYQAIPGSKFRWKAPWIGKSAYLMSCGDKAWVPLIGLTGYISYCPSLVTRQFGEMQYTPRTKGLAKYTGSFKEVNSMAELEIIKKDWGHPVSVNIDPHPQKISVSTSYLAWRSYKTPRDVARQSLVQVKETIPAGIKKRKIDEGDSQEDLDRLRIELSNSKSNQKFLEEQLLEEEQMRLSLDRQLQGKEEQISQLIREKNQLEELGFQHDDQVNRYEMMKRELVTLKQTFEDKEHADKELLASMMKERDHYKEKWETEKEKGRVAGLIIEEEKELKAQYKAQAENEFEARRATESDVKRYLTLANSLGDRISTLQAELETREEELKVVQEQRNEWQEHITEIETQLNSETTRFDAELRRAKEHTRQLKKMVLMLERNNDSLTASNEALLQDNTVFQHKIEQTDKLINMAARKADELRVKATMIGGSTRRFEVYLDELSSFVGLIANRGVAFE